MICCSCIIIHVAFVVTRSRVPSCICEHERHCELAPPPIFQCLTTRQDMCVPLVLIERLAMEIMSLLNHSRTKRRVCQLGRRKVISHSEIELEPSSSGAHCSDKTSHTIRHTRLDSEQLDPGLRWRKKKSAPFAPRHLFLLLHFWASRETSCSPSLELLPLAARLFIDTCLFLLST